MGGTNTDMGLVTENGNIIKRRNIATNAYTQLEPYVRDMMREIGAMVEEQTAIDGEAVMLDGIGIGAPNGNYSKGMKHFIMFTLGTGVGSGIVVDGKLVHGSTGAAGELGHAILIPHGRKCSCGREGCLETYTSARGIVQTYIELRREDPDGERMLKEVPDGEISSKLIGEAAHQGDPVALKTWAIVGDQLGLAMANSVTFSAPEAIFLMGGPAQVGEPLLRPLREAFERYLLNIFAGTCQIRMSELKANEVAILGAAALLKMKS